MPRSTIAQKRTTQTTSNAFSSPIIPQPLTKFIGRAHELKTLSRLFDQSRLITILGAGGAGKTRLALELAAHRADTVYFVPLDTIQDARLIPQTIARALGITEPNAFVNLESIVQHLQGRAVLLILDNCEHLIHDCAQLTHQLLTQTQSANSSLKILATSREPLGIGGEQIFSLPPLSLPDPAPMALATLRKVEAVELFLTCAGALQPTFTLDKTNAAHITQICRRLDGMPLAIELAAARVRTLSLAEIAARLDDRFRLLTSSSRIPPARHQTLHAALTWSYELLDTEERRVLRALAVFASGFDAQAVAHVALENQDDAADLLSRLADKSLLHADTSGETTRYTMHETVHQFALAKLREANEETRAREKHLDYWMTFVETHETKLYGGTQLVWYPRFEREHENFRAALRWGSADALRAERAQRLANALFSFWNIKGHWREAQHWFESLLVYQYISLPVRARALSATGQFAYQLGDWARADELLQASLPLFRSTNDVREEAWAMIMLGVAGTVHGEYARAESFLRSALELEEHISHTLGMAYAECMLALLLRDTGDFDQAETVANTSTAHFRILPQYWGQAVNLATLGWLERGRGKPTRARTHCRTALAQLRKIGDPRREGWMLILLALCEMDLKQYNAARANYRRAVTLLKPIGDNSNLIRCLEGIAMLDLRTNDPARAAILFASARAARSLYGIPIPPADFAEIEHAQTGIDAHAEPLNLENALTLALEELLTPARLAKKNHGGLTRRETEIASLVAQGKTNRQIASLLVLSPKTVEANLTRILSKLNLTTRGQLIVSRSQRENKDVE